MLFYCGTPWAFHIIIFNDRSRRSNIKTHLFSYTAIRPNLIWSFVFPGLVPGKLSRYIRSKFDEFANHYSYRTLIFSCTKDYS